MIGRTMYIWNLGPVLRAEGGAPGLLQKMRRAQISKLWINVADGASPFANVSGALAPQLALGRSHRGRALRMRTVNARGPNVEPDVIPNFWCIGGPDA